jgi:Putative beta-barrel porin-2, OmpL-like. bbp2
MRIRKTNSLAVKPLKTLMVVLFSVALFSQNIFSQSDSSKSKIEFSGFVDTYFSYNFNKPQDRIDQIRVFDASDNQFNLALAKLVIQKAAAPVGFKIDLAYGPTMAAVAGYYPDVPSLQNVEDAYITAIVPWGNGLTVNAGKLVTHMGAEVIETPGNINYSRSILFGWAIPFDHIGVSASYPFTDNLSGTLYLYNGWNIVNDNNTDKTVGAELAYSPTSSLSLIFNYIGGAEMQNIFNKTQVFEGILNYQITDAFSLNVDYNYGQYSNTTNDVLVWSGVSGILKYAFDDANYIAGRGELYDDPDGFTTGMMQKLSEFTFTYNHNFTSDFFVRLEYRMDSSSPKYSFQHYFEDSSGGYTDDNQSTALIGAVYSF